jgi:hypothetical protein
MSTPAAVTLKDPEQLYLDWEHAHWAAQDIDLSRDPADWARGPFPGAVTASGC